MIASGFRQTFIESWMFEMPVRTGRANDNFDILVSALQANVASGYEPHQLSDSVFQLVVGNIIFVWQGTQTAPNIIAELTKYQKGYAVVAVGKLQSSAESAESFYINILSIFKTLIFSGDIISDQGAGIWKKLIAAGHSIQIYDTITATSKRLIDPNEIDNQAYNNTHTRFVLSDSLKESMYVWNDFELLRIQSLTHNMTARQILNL